MKVQALFHKLASSPAASSPAIAWLLVAVYCLAIFLQSAFPAPGDLPAFPGMDKVAHILLYLFLGMLFARAFGLSLKSSSVQGLFLLAWLAAALYGASDEFHQGFVAARSADPLDWLADMVGGGLGAGLYLRFKRP